MDLLCIWHVRVQKVYARVCLVEGYRLLQLWRFTSPFLPGVVGVRAGQASETVAIWGLIGAPYPGLTPPTQPIHCTLQVPMTV